MDSASQPSTNPVIQPRAACFWERGRLVYNAILAAIVLLWILCTWPHFRPALTFGSLAVISLLALVANLLYTTAYLADFILRAAVPSTSWRRSRQVIFVAGTLFALLLANYWIVDEIYPYANQPPTLF